jgi:hypothetical protein
MGVGVLEGMGSGLGVGRMSYERCHELRRLFAKFLHGNGSTNDFTRLTDYIAVHYPTYTFDMSYQVGKFKGAIIMRRSKGMWQET